ncbi:TIGR03752 family integrating conjugative element protein [Pseudomonas aeruginosa]|uniref:TIGR03752 family integrating conjugative element protein n=1 Tax=Pseudomonas aeruginosa TaxID=287 RepID=UPI000F7FA073|nr:TIGR03752 family integrating conjugative element protein [Pseudomonas aeruginosa]RTB44134.1 TIGR03752 family integrating conjugative element protein [Pseudomonas aeruginosa]
MKSNGLLKWLMLIVVVVMLAIIVRSSFFSDDDTASSGSPNAGGELSQDEMKSLGIEGDTPQDTVATLVAQVKQLRAELQSVSGENQAQRSENERLRQREGEIDQRIANALENERSNLRREQEQVASDRQQADGLLQDLQRQLEGLSAGKSATDSDLPVGLGLRPGDGMAADGDGLHWVEPEDVKPTSNASGGSNSSTSSFPTSFAPAQRTLQTVAGDLVDASASAVSARAAKPVYTVPTNSTLMGSVAMTALIGRVPVDGTVNDPFPFKVLIGPDNLTANGIDIPDVAGAVVSGTASGDWTLSCVRGVIRSITFVFSDGTIRTLPGGNSESRQSGGNSGNNSGNSNGGSSQNGLGWISDPFGIPCVSGTRRSNAQQYLGTQALITAAGAGVAALIDSDSGQVTYANSNGSVGTVGISGNEAMGRILAGGVEDMSSWVNRLYGQAFAAVYVQPGAQVAVHLEQPLEIDYEPDGRKVDHRLGGAHAFDLD